MLSRSAQRWPWSLRDILDVLYASLRIVVESWIITRTARKPCGESTSIRLNVRRIRQNLTIVQKLPTWMPSSHADFYPCGRLPSQVFVATGELCRTR